MTTSSKQIKVQYASDLHLEFGWEDSDPYSPLFSSLLTPVGDVLVLAGDISVAAVPIGGKTSLSAPIKALEAFFKHISPLFKHIIYVPGNHEFYNPTRIRQHITITEALHNLSILCSSFPNIHLLNNTTISLFDGQIRFVGTPLWSEIPPTEVYKLQTYLRDFHCIYTQDSAGQAPSVMNVEHYNQLHREAVTFLQQELPRSGSASTTVVVTHHTPFVEGSWVKPSRGQDLKLTAGFSTDLSSTIKPYMSIDHRYMWICGHTHYNWSDVSISQFPCRVVSNQKGYSCSWDGVKRSRWPPSKYVPDAVLVIDVIEQ
eukprot:gnl/Dysnectes_brevis/4854_a6724_758.p1 GENE.gnl/Dysnectes_brevis/4854_a6724_758~~gnl/Dysnectes_brevis/4854_a6724_758.p1  ORF type:complete len:315 (-),score=15.31 gnl/Dysnectes_brevis/4854_a6724_758:47-991(-)